MLPQSDCVVINPTGTMQVQCGMIYDDLERKMLGSFFEFVKDHRSHIDVHWNMRDSNYGFQALYNRFRALGHEPVVIDESRLVDLAKTLGELYGPNYSEHPRLQKLIELNNMTTKGFLTGPEEAGAFVSKEYIRLHQSTLRKVDSLGGILRRQLSGKLRTKSRLVETVVADIKDAWVTEAVKLVLMVAGLVTLGNSLISAIGTILHLHP